MKRFDTFGEYMFDLLLGPLKRGKQSANQFRIFFRVIGRLFDSMKQDVFRVRDEANVASASPVMLPVHGQDCDMPRLEGEDAEAYRTRLSMKGLISEWGGTKKGILYALTALGYDQSYIEPFALQDPERWAEFIVFLKGSKQSGVNNLAVIDSEVMKVKEGSSLPSYGLDAGNTINIASKFEAGMSAYPRCGEIACGVFPDTANTGYLLGSVLKANSSSGPGDVSFPKVGTVAASNKFYQTYAFASYAELDTNAKLGSSVDGGVNHYLICSEKTYLESEGS